MGRVLVVDDELEVAKSLRRLLKREGWEVEIAASGPEGLERLQAFQPDIVVSDFRMPGMSGAEFLAEVKRRAPLTVRIILSGHAELEAVLASVNSGEVCRFLTKPWEDEALVALLSRMLADREVLATLFVPFQSSARGSVAETRMEPSRLVVRAEQGGPFTAEDALALVSRFSGPMEEDTARVVGGLLTGRKALVTFLGHVGGRQELRMELAVENPGAAHA